MVDSLLRIGIGVKSDYVYVGLWRKSLVLGAQICRSRLRKRIEDRNRGNQTAFVDSLPSDWGLRQFYICMRWSLALVAGIRRADVSIAHPTLRKWTEDKNRGNQICVKSDFVYVGRWR